MTEFEEKVEKVLEEKVRPMLAMDGGSVDLVSADEKTGEVQISFTGRCAGCPMAHMGTLNFIKDTLMGEIPEVKLVVPA